MKNKKKPKSQPSRASEKNFKEIVTNKKARFQYEVLETLEAGISLAGTEVKSLRLKQANISDAYCRIKQKEIYVLNLHVSPYKQGNQFNHEPTRERKLLLHKKEIVRLETKVKEKGLTIIPLKIYMTSGRIKLLVGLCRGKQLHDKRQDLKERDMKREVERALKKYS